MLFFFANYVDVNILAIYCCFSRYSHVTVYIIAS